MSIFKAAASLLIRRVLTGVVATTPEGRRVAITSIDWKDDGNLKIVVLPPPYMPTVEHERVILEHWRQAFYSLDADTFQEALDARVKELGATAAATTGKKSK